MANFPAIPFIDLGIPLNSAPINDEEILLLNRELLRRIAKDAGPTKDLTLLIGRLVIRINELKKMRGISCQSQ